MFAYRWPVDLRKGFEGLSALVRQALGQRGGTKVADDVMDWETHLQYQVRARGVMIARE